ncbi:MFS transporter [Nocardioides sp. Root140]|uniref:MFS transporter n=1 Tax=Nocardioides sp. Root140 TaxID=1736460 RepID=UPI0009E748D7|nr:MFS transporter [Nocardioides sp. Root140]
MSEKSLSEALPEVPPPVSKAEKKRLAWALVLISLAQLMVVLDSTIANIALPFIGEDLHINEANLTWIVIGYALAFGGLLLLGGRLGDLYGRRRIFMVGVVVFAIASLLGGIAWTEPLLLSSRALQGVGAAMASPAALALITTTFPAGPQRNRAFAVYAAMSGIGAAVGLILGGWLTGLDQPLGVDGWRLTFLINVPIGLVAAGLAPRFFEESEKHEGWLDIPGAITGTFGLLGLVYGFSRAGDERYGWGNEWTIASLAAGVALLVFFAVIESRVEHPLLPVRVFAHRTRAVSFIAMMILPAAMFAMFFFLSLFIQNVVGYSPLHAGFAFLPFSVGMIISATAASSLISRVDPRILAGTGSLVAAAALFGFSRLSVDESPSNLLGALSGDAVGADVNYWTQILPYVFLMALGMGMVFVPLTLTAVHHLRAQDSGVGSGVLNTMQQVGGALGLAVLATVSLHFTRNTGEEIAPGLTKAAMDAGLQEKLSPAKFEETMGQLTYLGAFTDGATTAFLVGAAMMLTASVIIWLFLDVKHEELATDGPEAQVHVG